MSTGAPPRGRTAPRLGAAAATVLLLALTSLASVASPHAQAATPSAATTTTGAPRATTTTAVAATTTTGTRNSTTTTGVASTTTGSTTTTTPHVAPTTTTTAPANPVLAAPGVSLVSQPPWIATGGAEVLELHLDEPALATAHGADVQVTVHRSVSSRTDFDQALSGAALGSTRSVLTFPLSSVPLDRSHDFLIGFGLSGSGASRQVGVDSPGVYPVEVGVVGTGAPRAAFVTWMVVVDTSGFASLQPLRVSWIWRIETGPLEPPDSIIDPSTLTAMGPHGRLDDIAKLLGRAAGVPLTLAIDPQTLTIWGNEARARPALAPGVRLVRRAAQRTANQLLPEPYVPIAGPTIEAEGLGGHVPEAFVAGSDAIEQSTGEIPDPRTAFVDPIDDATVGRLTQMLVGRYVVRDRALEPIAEPLSPAQPFTLTTRSGITAPAAATDSELESLVESTGPPALRVQRVLAALAEIAYEAPSQARGVVLATPGNWSPDVPTVALLLHDLARDPLVRPATLNTLFNDVAPADAGGAPLQRRLVGKSAIAVRPLAAADYADAVRKLTAYSLMVGRKDPSVVAGRHALLLSLSTANSPAAAHAYLQTITNKLNVLTAGITTTAKTLTLTARRADLPLSFQNNTGRAGIRVRVHLDSAKLIFPKGPDFLLTLPLGHTTAKRNQFPVEARASGTFAMTITLESPDGSIPLGAPTRVTIRSAVFSGIGIALTLGALLVLAGWWGNHFRRTRRARRRLLAT